MPEYFYRGSPLSSYSLWELGLVEKSIKEAEAKREEASKHPKLIERKIKLPLPNIEFLNLKEAIETEIKNRQLKQNLKANNNV